MSLTLRGERIAVCQVDFEFTGTLAMPDNQKTDFELGLVKAVGDGVLDDGTKKAMFVAEGRVVLFQVPVKVRKTVSYTIKGLYGGEIFSVIHQGDVFGYVQDRRLTLENFEAAGDWVLLEYFIDRGDSLLVLPDTVPSIETIRFRVLKRGENVPEEAAPVGGEVIIERHRANVIFFGATEYFLLHKSYLYGTV